VPHFPLSIWGKFTSEKVAYPAVNPTAEDPVTYLSSSSIKSAINNLHSNGDSFLRLVFRCTSQWLKEWKNHYYYKCDIYKYVGYSLWAFFPMRLFSELRPV